uniref:Cyclin N-terminal domain-containing protein n=1 Tax=Odontella aurita TaxID=265563 RepID=A0A7S4NA06_9STRA|mmetsp:Transcript_55088/g.165023  ORF Transcript_55088/g.165023 Transcript_55088/m.165023 type:complete len:534 (+) Transcript_55088:500-2101(+)
MRREVSSSAAAAAAAAAFDSSFASPITTELEDQIAALLRSEPAYSPSSCGDGGGRCRRDVGVSDGPSGTVVPHDEWRARIADWSYRVVDHFRYDREVVSVSMNYFDRFLLLTEKTRSSSSPESPHRGGRVAAPLSPTSALSTEDVPSSEIDSRTYQLAAMTSLYLAVKLHGEQPEESSSDASSSSSSSSSTSRGQRGGQQPPSPGRQPPPENRRKRRRRRRLRLLSFVELSRGQFRAEDITGMEKRMLETLRWRVNPPTPMVFVSYLLRLLPASPPPTTESSHRDGGKFLGMTEHECRDLAQEEQQRHDLVLHILHELSRYLAELSVCLSDVSAAHDPSALAYAAVLVSAECLTSEALPPAMLDDFLSDVRGLSPKLTEDNPDVIYLASRMREAFLPELLLDGTASTGGGDSTSEATGHPIAIAREAGLLDVHALYGSDDEQDIDSDGGYEYCESRYHEDMKKSNGSGAGPKAHKRRRNPSSNCVIEEASLQSQQLRGSPKRSNDGIAPPEEEEHDSPVCVSKVTVSVNIIKD